MKTATRASKLTDQISVWGISGAGGSHIVLVNDDALDVVVHSKEDISDHTVLHLLMDTCERWRTGWLALPLATFLELKTRCPFTTLKELRICTRRRPELLSVVLEEDSMLRCRAFRDAPRLNDVAVDTHCIFCDLFEVDWATVHLFRREKRLSALFVE